MDDDTLFGVNLGAADLNAVLSTGIAALLACGGGFALCQLLKRLREGRAGGRRGARGGQRAAGQSTGTGMGAVELSGARSPGVGKTPSKWMPTSLTTTRQARVFHQLEEEAQNKDFGNVLIE